VVIRNPTNSTNEEGSNADDEPIHPIRQAISQKTKNWYSGFCNRWASILGVSIRILSMQLRLIRFQSSTGWNQNFHYVPRQLVYGDYLPCCRFCRVVLCWNRQHRQLHSRNRQRISILRLAEERSISMLRVSVNGVNSSVID
jgi:hypothetical protein